MGDDNLIVTSVMFGVSLTILIGLYANYFVKYLKHEPDFQTQKVVTSYTKTPLDAIHSYAPLMGHDELRKVSAAVKTHD